MINIYVQYLYSNYETIYITTNSSNNSTMRSQLVVIVILVIIISLCIFVACRGKEGATLLQSYALPVHRPKINTMENPGLWSCYPQYSLYGPGKTSMLPRSNLDLYPQIDTPFDVTMRECNQQCYADPDIKKCLNDCRFLAHKNQGTPQPK